MDNITHSLAGLLTGELVARARPARRARTLLLFTGVAASNFPDLDLLLTPLLPQPLGYLLMHRGHTHTLIFLLPQAALLTLGIWALWPAARRSLRTDPAVARAFALTLFIGLGLHVAMDYANSYGIHPFYPFDPSWYFGDAVFIVEPLLWATLAGAVVARMPKPWVRRAWTGVIIGLPLLAAALGVMPMASWILCLIIYFGLGRLERRGRRGLASAAAASVVLIVAQAGLSRVVKARVMDSPGVLDVAASPLPGNPLCWLTHAIARVGDGPDLYEVRSQLISVWPSVLSPARCAGRLAPADERRARGSLTELRRRAAEDCRFDAWLRFARMPIVTGDRAVDVRFAATGRANFSQFNFREESSCPKVPGWGRPRQDLLDGR